MHEAMFVLPLPPSLNMAYPHVSKRTKEGKLYSKRVASQDLRVFKHDAHYILREQGVISPLWSKAKYLGYEATFYMRSDSSDLSNRIKCMEDILASTLGFNDKRIYALSCKKEIDRETPRVEVRLYTLEKAS